VRISVTSHLPSLDIDIFSDNIYTSVARSSEMGYWTTSDACGCLKSDNTVYEIGPKDNEGEFHKRQFEIGQFLGNIDGRFVWGGSKWSESARNVSLSDSILKAELLAGSGWVKAETNLVSRLFAMYVGGKPNTWNRMNT
jgi:hypothetical protein